MTELYSTGTIAVTEGSVDFVGTGTAWLPVNAKSGDTLNVAGHVMLIAEISDPTHGKFAIPYPGETAAGLPYAIAKTSSEWGTNRTLALQTAEMIQLLTTVVVERTGIAFDAYGAFANRGTHDNAAAGFVYLSIDGDGVTGIWTLYVKLSAGDGDWSVGQMVDENPGPAGPAGADGAPGVGVPAGGAMGQVLKKLSGTDYDTGWAVDAGGIGGSTGSTDNALVRADGTGGATLQGSAVALSDAGSLTGLTELLMGTTALTTAYAETGSAGLAPAVQFHGSGTVGIAMYRWSNNSAAARAVFGRSRGGGAGVRGVLQSGDPVGYFVFVGDDGTDFSTAAYFGAAIDGSAGAGNMPGRLVFGTAPASTLANVERLRIDSTGALIHRNNSTTIVDANSHLGLRSYTVATLPSAAVAARAIYVSDGTGNKRLAISDGTNWRFPDGAIVS